MDTSYRWSISLSGAGAATTYDANFVSTTLTSGTSSGSTVTVRTRTYFPYQPGKGQHFTFTGNFMSTTANVVKEIGAFDERNGVFFRLSGTAGLSVVIRSDTSGSVVDTVIPQESWDDKLDGTGSSKYNLDVTKAQIFVIDFEWLGVGQVRWSVQADKAPAYCYIKPNTNINTGPYMKKPNLPISYKMYNVGAATQTYMSMICAEVSSEGGAIEQGLTTGAPQRRTPISLGNGVQYPLISVRLRSGFERGTSAKPIESWVMPSSTTALGIAQLCFNCQVGGGTWRSITNTAFEYSNDMTAVTTTNTAAIILDSAGASDASGQTHLDVPTFLYGNYDFAQTTADIWTLVLYTITNNDTWTAGMTMQQFE